MYILTETVFKEQITRSSRILQRNVPQWLEFEMILVYSYGKERRGMNPWQEVYTKFNVNGSM
jgi:hypothetical protein